MILALSILLGLTALGCIAAWAGNRVVGAMGEPAIEELTEEPEAELDTVEQQADRWWHVRIDGAEYRYRAGDGVFRYPDGSALVLANPMYGAVVRAVSGFKETEAETKRRVEWATKAPKPKPVDPFGLASWMNVSDGKHRLTLNNGLSFEGFGRVNWLVYPSGEDAADWAEDVCHALAQQIKWGQHGDKQELNEIEKHDRRLAEYRVAPIDVIPERIGQVATAIDNTKLYAGHLERERQLQKQRDERQARIDAQMGAAVLSGYTEGLRNGYAPYTSGRLPVRVTDKPSSFESYVQWNSREELDELLSDPKMVEAMGLERKSE